MKKILLLNCLIGLLLFSFFFMANSRTIQAQSSFSQTYPFAPGNGTIGFFDQNTGKIYIYTSDLTKLVKEAQLEELGKEVKEKTVEKKRETYGISY